MTPATIIREAQAEGVRLALSTAGTIKASGDGAAVNRWLAVIREHKTEILEVLKASTSDTAPLTDTEETSIRAWLALIEKTDPATIAEVIVQCQQDADAGDYFTGRAAAELPRPGPFPDDRRTCDQCANLIARRCQAAKRGEIAASRNYEPIRDLPRRCEGYAPGAADTDRRPGRERWPGLIQKEDE
ncbi:hypothetical protein ACWJKU_19285 [Methylocaldum sp. MU1018]